MVRDVARSLWAEPRVPDPPVRVWRDWALVAALVPIAVVEGLLRADLSWRVLSVVVALALLPTLLWRRTHPVEMVVVAFGTTTAIQVAAIALDVHWEGLAATAFVILLFYSVFRWGSGRDGSIALGIIAVSVALNFFDDTSAGDVIGGFIFVLFVAAVGVAVRYQDKARTRGIDQIKLREREQLARELHDTVAHHVSAIAIRAQAGRVVAPSDPAAAVEALLVIEQEASRTLAEMRTMVGALRQGEDADLLPQQGVADIGRLATTAATERLRVEVELSGDLDGLAPSVDAALYRLAQESVTNAVRHARRATHVHVSVRGDAGGVRLTVADDGEPVPFDPRSSTGFGLIGMAERAKLLGGTLEAGPTPGRGWRVRAVLPRGRAGA